MLKEIKILLFYIFTCFVCSCTKKVDINISPQSPRLVVNCLFNPDSSWKIFVGKSRSLSDTVNISAIKNADIGLYDEAGNRINLVYSDSGYYISTQKPKAGIKYIIKVSASGYKSVEASDCIPDNKLLISAFQFDTIPTLITPANIFDNVKVNQLHLTINRMNKTHYCQLQVLAYNKNEFYDYIVTNNTLQKLKELHFIPDSIIQRISKLKNQAIFSETKFRERINEVTGNIWSYYDVINYIDRKWDKRYLPDLFKIEALYSQQLPFYNVTGDYYSVFNGNKSSSSKNYILLYSSYNIFDPSTWWYDPINQGKKKDVEIWLDLNTLSAAAYLFKTTYIKQQLNRENPFAQPVQVYNNIKDGYGIFAGYQKERLRIY